MTVTDANGCSTTCVANVMGLVTPSCSISNVVNVDCPGNSNGSFLATGMGGNSSIYSFTDGTTTNTDGVFTMLAAGTYMVTISEVANPSCSSVCTVQLTEPQFSCTTAVNSNVSCNGLADGSATVIPLGGTMPYTYAWDNGEMFSTAILLDAGTHIISVTDANGCITTCTVLITENPVLSCSVTTNSNSSCNGAADGVLTTTAVGGAGAYEYSIDGVVFQASGIFSGLTAGTYTLTTRDGNGCLTTCIGVITEPAILSCSTVSTLESDCGANDGTITVAPTGGTAGYTFDAGAGVVTSNIITNLGPGNYIVTVTDLNGCTSTCAAEIMSLSVPTCTINNIVNISCNGAAAGSFIASGMGGNSTSYNFTDGTTTNTDGIFTLLTAGNYVVTISEQGNPMCSSICSVTLIEPTEMTCTSALVSDVTCMGLSDGSATVTPVGGSSPYEYLWDNGETTALAQVLNAGLHTVTVTDANDCTKVCSIVISENPAVSCSAFVGTDVSCNGGANGTLIVVPAGGAGSYEFSLDGTTFQSGISFTNLAAGTFTVTTRDGNGCLSTCNTTITEPSAVTCFTTTTAVSDCGVNDGTITIFASGGTAGYTYDAGSGTVAANVISNLAPGTYMVTVTDANGCISNCTAEILGLNIPSCTISNLVNVDCNANATGSYLVTGVGGNTTAYTFADGLTTNTDGIFSAIVAGNYMVTISEQANPMCSSVCVVEITEPDLLTCAVTLVSNVSCSGMANGSATVIPVGGIPPYSYAWDNGEIAATAIMLDGATHIVTVTDANGCLTTCDVIVNENPVLTCLVSVNANVTCNSGSDGMLTALSSGGDGVYEYSLDGITFQSSAAFSALPAGSYTITSRDGNGCTSTCVATISEPAILSCTSTSTIVTDCGVSDGTITVAAVGGTSGYSYDAGSGTIAANVISNLAPGFYEVTVTDANGCTTTCSSVIDGLQVPSCSIGSVVNVDCNGEATGSFLVTGVGGNSTTYNFSDGVNANTDGVFTALTAGVYIVTISEPGRPRCTSFCMVEVTEPEVLTCTSVLVSNISCNGLSDGSATAVPVGGTLPYTYVWDNNETTPTALALNPGTHTVTVTDANNCITTCEILIVENLPVSCTTNVFCAVSCNGGSNGVFHAIGAGGDGNYEHSLDGITYQTEISFTDLIAGVYTVTTRDGNGCTSTCLETITEPAPLTCSTSTTIVSDCGINDGTITVTTAGGTAGYIFDAGAGTVTANVISGLSPGSYIVTVTDANDCTSSCTAIVSGLNMPTCTIGSVVNVDCNGNSTGSYIAIGTGGNSANYNFTDGMTTNTDGVFTGLSSGTYMVTISEQANPMCSSVCTAVISDPAILTCTTTLINHVTCNAFGDGSAMVNVMGGTAPFTYLWSNGETTATATQFDGGTQTVIVTDANGCTTSCDIVILENPRLRCTGSVSSPILCNGGVGSLEVMPTGGNGNYEYSTTGVPVQLGFILENLTAGTYTIMISDRNGCTNTCLAILPEPDVLTCSAAVVASVSCNGQDGSATAIPVGGTTPYSYLWDNGETTATAIALSPTAHTVTVTDVNGCTTSCAVTLGQNPPVSCTVVTSESILCNGTTGSLTASSSGGDGNFEYSLDGIVFQPSPIFTGLLAGPYTCLLYTSPSPRDGLLSRMPSSA